MFECNLPGSLRFASTWRELYFEAPGVKEQNLLMRLGFCSLGLEMIGLIVLWTGYRKKERWAWFVMLIILLFFVFPLNVLKLLLDMQTPSFDWAGMVPANKGRIPARYLDGGGSS
jgi:ABC-type uncharacterized transport system YnjBCD permease subunit